MEVNWLVWCQKKKNPTELDSEPELSDPKRCRNVSVQGSDDPDHIRNLLHSVIEDKEIAVVWRQSKAAP